MAQAHDRGLGYRIADFLKGPKAPWFNHVNLTAHPRGGHFVPWEVPDEWADDLRRTFRGRIS